MKRGPYKTRVPLAMRLERHIDRSAGPDACWPWTRYTNERGYGEVWDADVGHSVLAHRAAFKVAHGYLPDSDILHSCDNPPCCNPAHLSPGTHAENMRQASERGRMPTGASHAARRNPGAWGTQRPENLAAVLASMTRGAAKGSARLTETNVREIRRRYAEGEGQRALAREFGVSHSTIGHVTARRTWTHI